MCGYVVGFGWRWCFFVPAMLCTVAGGALFILLRDTPSSVGLPEIKVAGAVDSHKEDKSTCRIALARPGAPQAPCSRRPARTP